MLHGPYKYEGSAQEVQELTHAQGAIPVGDSVGNAAWYRSASAHIYLFVS